MNVSRVRASGVALVLSALAFGTAETVSAAAWTTPAYSYAHNFISDLGNPQCGPYDGRVVCSPLAGLMNSTGFALHGLLLGLAVVLLFLDGRASRVVLGFALATTAGDVLVGLVHSSPAASGSGTLWLHAVGATFAILGANTVVVLLGRARRSPLPVGVRRVSSLLGAVGFVAALVWRATSGLVPPGIPERLAVYPYMVAELVVGAALIAVAPQRPAGSSQSRLSRRRA